MTSILTNNGAIVALQTLKMTNMALAKTQNQISTGRSINKASDGAATWAIAKTMETDRDSFATISRGLNNAATVVGVAEEKAAGIKDDLNSIKQLLLQAANPDNDVTLNWGEVEQWIKNIESKINQAQFNGVNLLNKDGTGNGDGEPYRVIGSLDRAYGENQTSHTLITVASSDLKTKVLDVLQGDSWREPVKATEAQALISGTAVADAAAAASTEGEAAAAPAEIAYDDYTTAFGEWQAATDKAAVTSKYAEAGYNTDTIFTGTDALAEADYKAAYTAPATPATPAAIDHAEYSSDFATWADANTDADGKKVITDKYAAAGYDTDTIFTGTDALGETAYNEARSAELDAGLVEAADSIESLIKVVINETARLGSAKTRIESQVKSVDQLKDALTQGIGTLVDADLEEASARLQALQAQQQLGIQALSIANQAPQSVLALFR